MVRAVVDADAAARRQQVVDALGQQAAVGDLVDAAVLRPVAGDRHHVVERLIQVLACEHVAPDEAARLGDAEGERDVREVGLLEAGRLAAQPIDLLHHHAPALDLGVGEVVRVGGVDAPVDAAGRAPGHERLAGTDGAKAARFLERLHVLDARHAKPEPGMHLLQLERLACQREEVAVAGGVDDRVAGDRLPPRLRREDDVRDAVAVEH